VEWTAAGLRRHLLEELLPYWAERGVDRACGGFHNRLDGEGRPLAEPAKRLLVQTRQVFAFSEAARLGAAWALELAARGVDFIEGAYRDRVHGGYFHTATPAGAPLDRRKDCYGHAFVVFAFAAYHRAARDAAALARARETLELAFARLRDPLHGGLREAAAEDWTPLDELPRRHNPHMHWLEAMLALDEAAPGAVPLEEADRVVDLLRRRWFDAAHACLGEFYGRDWTPLPAPEGDQVEPGHHFEWTWLLARYARARGAAGRGADELAAALFGFAERHGVDADGGVFDRVDRRGRVLADSKRLWPQTERCKALAVRGEVAGLRAALAGPLARYRRPDGGWREHLARDGTPTTDLQNATSVYHVVLALREAMEVLGG
jgi:mannose-6-phosphate isomerase